MVHRRLGPVGDDDKGEEEAAEGVHPPDAGVEADYFDISGPTILREILSIILIGKRMEPVLNMTSVMASSALDSVSTRSYQENYMLTRLGRWNSSPDDTTTKRHP